MIKKTICFVSQLELEFWSWIVLSSNEDRIGTLRDSHWVFENCFIQFVLSDSLGVAEVGGGAAAPAYKPVGLLAWRCFFEHQAGTVRQIRLALFASLVLPGRFRRDCSSIYIVSWRCSLGVRACCLRLIATRPLKTASKF